jgi:hypothetical protein
VTIPSAATPPAIPEPNTLPGPLACMKDVVKEVSPSSGRCHMLATREWRRQVTGGRPCCGVSRPLINDQNASIIRQFTKEAVLRVLGALVFSVASIVTASAGEPLPESGAAKLAVYAVCHPLAVLDMGSGGSQSSSECNGIVKNLEGPKLLDNLAIRCLEDSGSRPEGYKYSGTCVQTDGDGDKLFMTYEGSESGQIKWIGGTGKYKDVAGAGSLSVADAPGATPNLFAYTLNYDVSWTHKSK